MAIGIPPRKEKTFKLNSSDTEKAFYSAIQAAEALNWKIITVGDYSFVASTGLSIISYGEEVIVKITDDELQIKSKCSGLQIIDLGKNNANINYFYEKYCNKLETISFVEMRDMRETLSNSMNEQDIETIADVEQEHKKRNFFSYFIPRKNYFITPILINLNLLVFIAMALTGVSLLHPSNQELMQWGANFSIYTLDGEQYRLLTSTFVHIGIFHLLFNIITLAYIGLMLEPYLGRKRLLISYLGTGIISSLASLKFNTLLISAGASGAIFGLFGVFISLLISKSVRHSKNKNLIVSLIIFMSYNLAMGFKADSNIDNAAHIGGLLSGILMGLLFIPSVKNSTNRNLSRITNGVLICILVGVTFAALSNTSDTYMEYNKALDEAAEYEEKAQRFYNLPEETPNSFFLKEIEETSIPMWEKYEEVIRGIDTTHLLPELIETRRLLLEYGELQKSNTLLIYNSLGMDSIEFVNEYEKNAKEINIISDKIDEINHQ